MSATSSSTSGDRLHQPRPSATASIAATAAERSEENVINLGVVIAGASWNSPIYFFIVSGGETRPGGKKDPSPPAAMTPHASSGQPPPRSAVLPAWTSQ